MRTLWRATAAMSFAASTAAAQGNPSPADALFDKGVEDMGGGRFAAACPAIAESLRLDPRPGTLFTLAECESKWGKGAAALRYYKQYLEQVAALPAAQQGKHGERKQRAADAVKRLAPSLSRVTLSLAAGAPRGLEIVLDGERVDASSLGKPLDLDPGQHTAVVRGAGKDRSQSFSVAPGEARQMTLEPPGSEPPLAPPPSSPPAAAAERADGAPTRRTIMYAAAGVGAAGLVAGSIGGAVALSKKSDVNKGCVALLCSAAGQRAVESGRSAALVGTIGFGVALLGAGVATTLFLLDRRAQAPSSSLRWSPLLARSSGGLAMEGTW